MLSDSLHSNWILRFAALSRIFLDDISLLRTMSHITSFSSRELPSCSRLFLSFQILYTVAAKQSFLMEEENELPEQIPTILYIQSSQGIPMGVLLHLRPMDSQVFFVKGHWKNKWSWVSKHPLQRRHWRWKVSKWSLSWVPSLLLIASQRKNPHLGIASRNQINLCQGIVACLTLNDCHADFIENCPEFDGIHLIVSLVEGSGIQSSGITCFKVRRSGEFETGQRQCPFCIISLTRACLGNPES